MNSLPEQQPEQPQDERLDRAGEQAEPDETPAAWQPDLPADLLGAAPGSVTPWPSQSPAGPWPSGPQPVETPRFEPPRFAVEPLPPARIPHFGHLLFLLFALMPIGLLATGLLTALAMHNHLFGVSTAQQAMGNVHYILGSEALLYLFTFVAAYFIFPLFWHKSLLAGLQWNGAAASRLRNRLFAAAVVCFVLAILNGELLPGPSNTPIEKVFKAPGAPWLLFAFGVSFAPFFEEMFFRGFLLPSLCTAYDWLSERIAHEPMRPLGPNGHPQWSFSAMAFASVLTSIPFAWLHAAQTGYSIGPFLLLVGVSLVLCAARLVTRSLACSVFVHASYNFLLFSVMLIATGGFRHLDKI